MLTELITLGTSLFKGYSAYQQATKYNEQLALSQQSLENNYRNQLTALSLQQKQLRAQANQQIIERKLQSYKTQQGTIAHTLGMGAYGGGTLMALLGSIQQDTAKDVGIIDANLQNYLVQAKYQQAGLATTYQNNVSQLQSQEKNPFTAALQGAVEGMQLGNQINKLIPEDLIKKFLLQTNPATGVTE